MAAGDDIRVSSAHRYLNLLKGALVNEHHLEHEQRLNVLVQHAERGHIPDLDLLRDPARSQIEEMRRLRARRDAGVYGDADIVWRPPARGRMTLDLLDEALSLTIAEVPGDIVHIGVDRGGEAVYSRGFLDAHEIGDRDVWLVDPFRADAGPGGVGLAQIRDTFARFDLLDDRVRFQIGEFPDVLDEVSARRIALVRIDGDDPALVDTVLVHLGNRLHPDALVVLAPTCVPGRDASGTPENTPPPPSWTPIIDAGPGGLVVAVETRPVSTRASTTTPPSLTRPIVETAGPAPASTVALTVIVVLYQMRREAARTLYSLSRRYQLDIGDLDYEVLVIDNGSDDQQRLTPAEVEAHGPQFRLIEMGEHATSSPTPALVEGLRIACGDVIAFMIDGAHVLTPRVFSHALRSIDAYAPAVVAVQAWYCGPGQQNDAMLAGYDQSYEDVLFDQIDWPSDGYRLFDIGSFVADRDWLDGMWESNCFFAPRGLLEQIGGFDGRFDETGGGYANLDLYERLGGHPDTTLVTLLGEASFHQVHGGTTTNEAEVTERGRKNIDYRQHFINVHGRPYAGPAKRMHFAGSLWGSNKRSRPRLTASGLFAKAAEESGRDMPIPDDVRSLFTEASFRSPGWKQTVWSGHSVARAATDLVAYQELLESVRPDVVLVTTAGDDGGLVGFVATVLGRIGSGEVIAVGPDPDPDPPAGVRWLRGRAHQPATADRVRALVGDRSLFVVIGRDRRPLVERTFERYSDLVPAGGYVIAEDTVVNGNPAFPEHGPGPHEAVREILQAHDDFVVDPRPERLGFTFNPGGYLLRRAREV